MQLHHNDYLFWIFGGNADLPWLWKSVRAAENRTNNTLRIAEHPVLVGNEVGLVDLAGSNFDLGNTTFNLNDGDGNRLIIDRSGTFQFNFRGVDYFEAALDKDVTAIIHSKHGFATNGSAEWIKLDVGWHDLIYTYAHRDSFVQTGVGQDKICWDGAYRWAFVRRDDDQLDAYNLHSGYRVRMADWQSLINWGGVEEICFDDRNGKNATFFPPTRTGISGDRLNFDVIDLSNQALTDYTDRFIAASFKSIHYATQNVYTGTAIVEEFRGDTVTEGSARLQSASRDHITTNGNHHLIVDEEAVAIDGHLRLYLRDNNSGLYNRFNEIFLGTSASEVNTNNYSTTSLNAYATNQATGQGATPVLGTAMYGFGGNDVLTGGAGVDYLFGGKSTYTTISDSGINPGGVLHGNILTGGDGADFFGVGNISHGRDGDAIMTTDFTVGPDGNRLSGTAPLSTDPSGQLFRTDASETADLATRVATDRIQDWTAGVDSLRVLGNGTAIIEGLGTANGLGVGGHVVDLIGGDAERIDLSGALVRNEGKIVARGLGGNDTIIGSDGVDWLYGGDGTNYIYLGRDTASDRVFVDQIIGKQVVREFNNGDFNNNVDKIYLNVDALISAQARWFGPDSKDPYILSFNPHGGAKIILPDQPELVKDSTINLATSFSNGRSSAFSLDLGAVDVIYYPWSEAYLGLLNSVFPRSNGAWVNNSHIAADLTASLALGLSGSALVVSGIAALQWPFTIPLGISLIALGSSQIAAAATSSPHLNAVYKTPHHLGEYFVNDLTAAKLVNTSLGVDDTPLFTSFFWDNIPTRFAKAVEFADTRAGPLGNTNGITTFAVLRSNVETFIYFIQSEDHIITDDEARLVAEIESLVPFGDLVGYLGSLDIYNQTGVATPIFAQNVSLTTTVDVGTVSVSARMKDASILLNITLEGNPSPGDTIDIFDGTTKLATITTALNVTSYTYTHSFAPPASGFEKFLNYNVVSKSSQGFSTSSQTISLIYDNKAPEIVSVQPAGVDSVSVVVTGNDISVNEQAVVRLMENGSPFGAPTAIEASGSSVSFTIPASGSLGTIRTFTVEAADPRGNFVSHGTKIFALTNGNDGTSDARFIIPDANAITFALAGDAYIDGTSGNDVLVLGVGTVQVVDLKGGDDTLIMTAITPSSGVTIVADGGDGVDTVDFSQITQALNINLAASSFSFIVGETPGTATVSNFENVIGSQGNDVIIGSFAANNLSGGDGNDTIFGGMGADVLTGGAGADIFAFNSSAESAASVSSNTTRTFDQITDFTSATDKIQLDAVGAIDFLSTATAVRTAVSVSNVADFAALVTELGTLTASTVSAAQVYDVTLTGTGLAASGMTRLVIVNDGDTGLDADDLMIHLSGTSSGSILHLDFQFVA